jgi:hypothetical protein
VFLFGLGIIKSRRQIGYPHTLTPAAAMQLNVKTILNLKEKHPHFVYHDVRLTGAEDPRIEVKVEPPEAAKASVLAVARHVGAMTDYRSANLSMFRFGALP